MLALVTVTNALDVVNGDTSSITNLMSNHGGDGIALREAILATNADVTSDMIEFEAGFSGTISLVTGEMVIDDELTINGPGQAVLTIDANQQSRIFNITSAVGDFAIADLALINGNSVGDNVDSSDTTFSGGAIRSLTSGMLTLDDMTISASCTDGAFTRGGGVFAIGDVMFTDSTISGNSTGGVFDSQGFGGGVFGSNITLTRSNILNNSTHGRLAPGGGVFAENNVTLVQSIVSGNSTTGNYRSSAGGIFAGGDVVIAESRVSGNSTAGLASDGGGVDALGDITVTSSTIEGNHILGLSSRGGGIYGHGLITLTDSIVSGNSTEHREASGGGIFARDDVMLIRSTISGNSTLGDDAEGGGVYARGDVILIQSTVSGNKTHGLDSDGGGIFEGSGNVSLTNSTVTDNHALGSRTSGGGIHDAGPMEISGSIVAGNTAVGGGPDLWRKSGTLTVEYSLIGDSSDSGIIESTGPGNILNQPALLGPLADNGGPTQTHALLPNSLAIDAGDPAIGFDANEFDQRGMPYIRVVDGNLLTDVVIDIGAYEAQGPVIAAPGDYNRNGVVDAADSTVWRDNVGAAGLTPLTGADGDGDGAVTDTDYDVWRSHFGFVDIPPAPATTAALPSAALRAISATATNVSSAESPLSVKVSAETTALSVKQVDNPQTITVDVATARGGRRAPTRTTEQAGGLREYVRRLDQGFAQLYTEPITTLVAPRRGVRVAARLAAVARENSLLQLATDVAADWQQDSAEKQLAIALGAWR